MAPRPPKQGEVVEVHYMNPDAPRPPQGRAKIHGAELREQQELRGLAQRVKTLEGRNRTLGEQRHEIRRQEFLDKGLGSGRIATDEIERLSRMFDAAPEQTMLLVAGRPADGRVAQANEAAATFAGDGERQYLEQASTRLNLDASKVV